MNFIIAIDSDGTLKRSDGTISETTKEAIRRQLKKSNIVVICTARPRYHTIRVSEEVGASDYIISSNGSEIFNKKTNELIWAVYLTKEDCIILYEYAQKHKIRIMFVLENTEYVTQFTRNNNQVLLNDDNFNHVLNGNVKQAMIIGAEKEKIKKFKEIVQNDYKLNVVDSSKEKSSEMWFSVVSKDSSKGLALVKLAEYLKITSNNIIAIGNDNNDISMFKVAKISVAVSNATKEAKNTAMVITKSNDEDGVAYYLNSL